MNNIPRLGWGLVGASNIARSRMIAAINAQPDSQVVAVMSSDAARARRFASENNIPRAFDSLDSLLSDPDVDVVYVSTTNELHKGQTIAAAQAGKHVLCEKPLALTLEDALDMAEACRRANVVMGTNHHLRNAVTHRTLRRLVAEGAIGQPLAVRLLHVGYLPLHLQGWRINRPDAGGGIILDITVHDADTLRFVLDDEVEDVFACAAQQGLATGDLEDAVMGVTTFRRGTQVQFHDAYTIRHAGTGIEIHGTEGSLIGEDVMSQDPRGHIFLSRQNRREEIDPGPHEDLYLRSVRLFNEAARGKGQPAATAEDGIRSLAVALAAKESARTGCRVSVRYR